jgi:hypothetical protein
MCQLQCTLGIPGQLSLSTWGNGMRREPLRLLLGIVLALASFTGLVALMSYTIPDALGIDWRLTYRPAALALLRGDSPYGVGVAPEAPFFAAPWGLLPLLPLAWLPAQTGRLVVMLAGVVVFAYAAYRLGASPFAMAVFLVSPPVVHCIVNANIEWLPLLGFALPPRLGLLLVTIKPQTGVAVAVFWLVEGWRKGGWREIVSVVASRDCVRGLRGGIRLVASATAPGSGCWRFLQQQPVAVFNSRRADATRDGYPEAEGGFRHGRLALPLALRAFPRLEQCSHSSGAEPHATYCFGRWPVDRVLSPTSRLSKPSPEPVAAWQGMLAKFP